jgi:hypothetical protein
MSTRKAGWIKFVQRPHSAESSFKDIYPLLGLSIPPSPYQLERCNVLYAVVIDNFDFIKRCNVLLDPGGVLSLTPSKWHTGQEQDSISHNGPAAGELDTPFRGAGPASFRWEGEVICCDYALIVRETIDTFNSINNLLLSIWNALGSACVCPWSLPASTKKHYFCREWRRRTRW